MLSMDGTPPGDDGGLIKKGIGKGNQIERTGQPIAHFPSEVARGTSVEIFEAKPDDEAGLINIRDRVWIGWS